VRRSPEPERLAGDPLGRAARSLAHRLASGTTRRSFLAGVAAAAAGVLGARAAEAAPRRPFPGTERISGGWYGFCGHYFTTGSCPGPHELPRVDARGYPLRPSDGHPVDNLGRPIDALGRPVDLRGDPLRALDGTLLPRAPRTRLCEDWVPSRHRVDAVTQGAWYRCCNGQIRKLADCCSPSRRRINGDGALVGYCRPGRRVFCVMYVDTGVPC
jgi:hypothetical protein